MVPFSEFLNKPDEVHALVNGLWAGVRKRKARPPKDEGHYYKAGYMAGKLVQVVGGVGGVAAAGKFAGLF